MLSFGVLFFSLVEIMVPRRPCWMGQSRAGGAEAQIEPWGESPCPAPAGRGGRDAEEPPWETEAGEGGLPAASPRTLRPCQTSCCRSGGGSGGGSAERTGPAWPPGQARCARRGEGLQNHGAGAGEEVGSSPPPAGPLTWHAGARRAELVELAAAAAGAAARRAQSRHLPYGGGGEAGREGPRPVRDPAPGGLHAARGAGVLCLRASGAPRASVAGPAPGVPSPPPRLPRPPSLGLTSLRERARAGVCRLLPSRASLMALGSPIEAGRGRGGLGLRVSRLRVPLPGARRSAVRVSMASSLGAWETKEAGGRPSLLGCRPAHLPPAPLRPPPHSPPSARLVQAPSGQVARLGMRGGRKGPRGEFT